MNRNTVTVVFFVILGFGRLSADGADVVYTEGYVDIKYRSGEIIEALKENGLRDKVKVLIGGAAVSDEYAQEIGADAYCVDGFHAIKVLDAFQESKA